MSAERIDAAYDHAETLLTYAKTDNQHLQAVLDREGTVKVLVGILAHTLRSQIHGPPSPDDPVAKRWRLGAAVAHVTCKMLVNNSSAHADQLATLLLRTEALHACAQQMAAAAELLRPYASIAPSAPSAAAAYSSAASASSSSASTSAVPSVALLALACGTLATAMAMLSGIADRARDGSPAVSAALASALASSSVMEHAGRLVLLMVQAVAAVPAGDTKRMEVVREAANAFSKAYSEVENVRVELRAVAARVSNTAAAGNEGNTQGQEASRDGIDLLGGVVTGRCARHAAVSLGLAVVASADGGPTYGLPPAAACTAFRDGLRDLRYCHRLRRVPYSPGWTSEVVADTWHLVGEAAEHVLPYMSKEDQRNLGKELSALLVTFFSASGSSCAAALPTPVALPLPPAPALLAAALRGGALPLLERLLRRACVDPAGPESRALGGAAEGARLSDYPGECLVGLLAYGDVRQAAALVTTLGKVLRAKGCRSHGEGKLEVDNTLGATTPALEFAVLGTAGLLAAFRGSHLVDLLRSLATADAICAGEGPASEASGGAAAGGSGGRGGGDGAGSSSTGGDGTSGSGGGGSDAHNTPCGSGPTAQLGWMVALGLPAWLPPLSYMLQACLLQMATQANNARIIAPTGKLVTVLVGFTEVVFALLELGYPAAPVDGRESGPSPAADTSEAAAWARAVLAEVAVGPVFWLAMKYLSRPADERGGLEDGELRRAATVEVLIVSHAWLAAGLIDVYAIKKLLAAARALQRSGQAGDNECRLLVADVVEKAEARLAAASGAGAGGEPAEASPAAAAGWVAVLPAFPGLPAAVVLPACAYPACASLAGDSEAGLKLQRCARCGLASYCCRECQTAHWRSGHKEACVAKGG
ncbi:hypothetical protein HYH03_003394 [Edaphochlamys debaryana]|uniref:phytol kinase n=1 Tax=Edaphochlamys debaryana TaxID=47281 RepID=A0A835Y9Q5_9CHLO|nr:hypothetical protein HYH03_003394 [Edaphochlamys debaryana]|eukprot:KAG2498648.1 hypothetical protein HYH03_003394 [Edaphochlamys debaryana]